MSFGDWLRQLFSRAPSARDPGEEATLREEYGAATGVEERGPDSVAGAATGLPDLEETGGALDAVDADEPPRGSAP